MYRCMGCGSTFEKPVYYSEDTNEPLPCGVRWKGCPDCKDEDFYWVEACSICGIEIRGDGDYIELKTGEGVCENCYTRKNIYEVE